MSKYESGLEFDGMAGTGVNRAGNRFSGNQQGLTMKENYGQGPRKAGTTGDQAGPSTAKGEVLGHRSWEPKAGQNYTGNADKINVGSGPRVGNK